jgi:ribosomal protein L37AE/L43A
MQCKKCDNQFSVDRAMLGYTTCLDCGEQDATETRLGWTIVPLPKQGYTRITNVEELKHLNQKSLATG